MADEDAGRVGFDVVPQIDPAGWGSKIKSTLNSTLKVTGRDLGKTLSSSIKDGFASRDLAQAVADGSPAMQAKSATVGAAAGKKASEAFKAELTAGLKDLPAASVKASLDQATVDRARAALDQAAKDRTAKIKVEVDTSAVDAELAGVKAKIAAVNQEAAQAKTRNLQAATAGLKDRTSQVKDLTAQVNAVGDTADADAKLDEIRAKVDALNGKTAKVKVDADTGGALSDLKGVGFELAALAAIPSGGVLLGGLGGLLGGLTAGGAGAGAVAAVALPGISAIKTALAAQKSAQQDVNNATSQGVSTQNAAAIAAGQSQLQTLQLASAQAQLGQAQQGVRTAQMALTQAQIQAKYAQQDLNNQVKDAALSQRSAALQVKQARLDLDKVLADPSSSELAREQAQLTYDQQVQQAADQKTQLTQLKQEKAASDKAGIQGSQQVVQAQQQLTQALASVASAQRGIQQQQIQGRVAAMQAAQQTNAVSTANTKLASSLAGLTGPERALAADWQSFTKTYTGWAKSLEPEVFPVLAGGLALVSGELPQFNGLVVGSSKAMLGLERDAKAALAGPFWKSFLLDVSAQAPTAITDLGHIAGGVFTGIGGSIKAFLPYTGELLGDVESLTSRFGAWGQQLGTSSGFGQFMAYVRTEGPLVVHDVADIGGALISIVKAGAPLANLELQVIGPLAKGLGDLAATDPQLVRLAAVVYGVVKANQALQLTSVAKGFLEVGGAEAVAGDGAVGMGAKIRALGINLSGVDAEAATTKDALVGLAGAGAVVGAALVLGPVLQHLHDDETGTVQSTDKLTRSLTTLAQNGQWGTALGAQFKVSGQDALSGATSVDEFTGTVRTITDPSFADYVQHAGQSLFSWLPGITSPLDEAKNKINAVDTALTQMVQNGQTVQAAEAFRQLWTRLVDAGVSTAKIDQEFPQYRAQVGQASASTLVLTARIQAENQALDTNAKNLLSAKTEVVNFETGLNSATAQLTTNGKAFYGNSTAALANRSAFLQLAGQLQSYTDQLASNNELTDSNVTRIQHQWAQLVTLAEKFGLSKGAAEDYVKSLENIPQKVSTSVSVTAKGSVSIATGQSGVNTLLQQMFGPNASKAGTLKQLLGGHAGGGHIAGPGGPRSDNLLTTVSPKEFVVNAPATARYLPILQAWNDEGNEGTIYKGRGYAGGGYVQPGIVAPSYASSYAYSGDAAGASYGQGGNAALIGVAHMVTYALGRTALAAQGVLDTILLMQGAGGGKAVTYAEAQLGKPYQWGATGPNTFDCSGLTMRAWEAAGKQIGRTTYDQVLSGAAGSRTSALPGDLHFPDPGHVMMFVAPRSGGASEMIHAPHTGTVVQYAPFRGGGVVRLIASGGGSIGSAAGDTSVAGAESYARSSLPEFGWSSAQWPSLLKLWTQESGWRYDALNEGSGAYGIPQALPADKMAAAGSDWRSNPQTQIRWGMGYIGARYGSPSAAEDHEKAYNWYAAGTGAAGAAPGWAWVGEQGPELVRMVGGETVVPHDTSMALSGDSLPGGSVAGYAKGTKDLHVGGSTVNITRIADELGKSFLTGLEGSASKIKSLLGDLVKDIDSAFKGVHTSLDNKLTKYIAAESKQLQALATKRDALAAQISAAKTFSGDTASGASQWAGIAGLQLGIQPVTSAAAGVSATAAAQGLYATGGGYSASGILSGLQANVTELKAYSTDLNKLKSLGYSDTIISQIIAAGPEQGMQLAAALAAATPSQVKQINAAQKSIGTASTAVGNSAANDMYGAGVAAGKGVVAGLQAQESAIEREMTKIAKAMEKKLKEGLKIKSPSQVMMDIGVQSGAGVVAGLQSTYGDVRMSAERMVALIGAPAPALPAAPSAGGPLVGEVHIHNPKDKDTKQAVTDALHDSWVLHRNRIRT